MFPLTASRNHEYKTTNNISEKVNILRQVQCDSMRCLIISFRVPKYKAGEKS